MTILFLIKDRNCHQLADMAVTRSQRAKPSQNEERRDSSSSEAAVTEDVEVTKSSATENEPPKKPEKAAVKESDHLRGGVDDPLFRDYAEGLIPKSDSKASASDLRMPELPCPQNPFQKYLRFPPAKTLGDRDWPKISYGVYAPEPRWRVCPDTTDPQQFGKDHTEDLIKKATGKWRMKGVRPNDDPKSNAQTHKPPLGYDYSVGLGALRWTFDEGKKDAWKGLNRDQLHEYAFRCLWETTQRQTYRRQIEKDIRSGPFREGVRNAASPMPPLPSAPKEGNFPGFKNNEVGTTSPEKNYQTWHLGDGYQRDSLAIRAGWMPEEQHPITRRMFEFRRQQILNAKDPDSEDYEDTSSDSDSKGSPTSENPPLSREIDPEKLEAPAPSEKQKSSTPTGDEGKSARIGEYKCVWLSVVL